MKVKNEGEKGRRMTRSRWRGCESLQEMKVRFASTLLPSFSLPRRHRIPHSRPFHNLDYIQNSRIQNTNLF